VAKPNQAVGGKSWVWRVSRTDYGIIMEIGTGAGAGEDVEWLADQLSNC